MEGASGKRLKNQSVDRCLLGDAVETSPDWKAVFQVSWRSWLPGNSKQEATPSSSPRAINPESGERRPRFLTCLC